MALTYFLIPVLFKREMIGPGLAKFQPYLFGLGPCNFFCLVMMGAGTLGVSRRHWDICSTGGACLRVARCGLPDDGAGWHRWWRNRRWCALHLHHRGFAVVGQAPDAGRQSSEFTPIPLTTLAPVVQTRLCRLRRQAPSRWRWCFWCRSSVLLLHQLEVSVAGLGPEL